jgi:hypothetical protein
VVHQVIDRLAHHRHARRAEQLAIPVPERHETAKSASDARDSASRASLTFLSNKVSSVSVVSTLYPVALPRSSDVSPRMLVIQPGICATSWARWASGKDLGWGFHFPLSLGTRSKGRRVVAIS